MIGYATLGTNDIDRALTFYDGLFAAIGGKRLMQMPDERLLTFYGAGRGQPMLGIGRPYDGGTATSHGHTSRQRARARTHTHTHRCCRCMHRQ